MSATAAILTVVLAGQSFGAFGGTGSKGGGGVSTIVRPASVGWYGDSRTQGACSGTSPPVRLDALLPGGANGGYTVANKGVSGETAHEIAVRVFSGAATACLNEPCGHYIVAGGVNSLKSAQCAGDAAGAVAEVALNGLSGSASSGTCNTAVADDCGTLDSVDKLHALYPNARVFVIGEMPYAGCDNLTCPSLVEPGARAAAYNAGLQTACAARSWLTCIFPYDDFEDPQAADQLHPDYECADGIHLLDAGSAALAQKVYNAATW